jgi:hypothetical protein
MGFAKVERPVSGLELLDARGSHLPSLKLNREAHPRDGIVKLIGFRDDPLRVAHDRRRRGQRRHESDCAQNG